MNVFLLTFFCSAANQDYKPVPIFAKVNSVTWTKINPVLVNTRSNAFGVGQIALLHARQSSRDLGRRLSVQMVEPSGIRTASAPVKVFAYFDHGLW